MSSCASLPATRRSCRAVLHAIPGGTRLLFSYPVSLRGSRRDPYDLSGPAHQALGRKAARSTARSDVPGCARARWPAAPAVAACASAYTISASRKRRTPRPERAGGGRVSSSCSNRVYARRRRPGCANLSTVPVAGIRGRPRHRLRRQVITRAPPFRRSSDNCGARAAACAGTAGAESSQCCSRRARGHSSASVAPGRPLQPCQPRAVPVDELADAALVRMGNGPGS